MSMRAYKVLVPAEVAKDCLMDCSVSSNGYVFRDN
jgi:hypothetical protein